MKDDAQNSGPSDEDILIFEVSDAALEAAANPTARPAMSFIGAPTVSILVSCCSNDTVA